MAHRGRGIRAPTPHRIAMECVPEPRAGHGAPGRAELERVCLPQVPRDFTTLGNCQAIMLPYDGKRAGDGRRCYLKPDFLPQDRPYWRAREAGEL